MKIAELQNRKIAIVGYGIEGESIARFLRKRNIPFAVLDHTENMQKVEGASECVFGENYLKELNRFDLIIRAPGVKPFLPELLEFQKSGGLIETQTRIFFDNYPNRKKIIGVTGTKGKGTTCILLSKIIENDGQSFLIGGNIGKGMFDLLDDPAVKNDPWIILELSSFQLQDLESSPHISVVLMVTSDHLDYHRSVDEYVDAKLPIAKYQDSDDIIVYNADYPSSVLIAESSKGNKYGYSTQSSKENTSDNIFISSSKEEGQINFIENKEKILLGNFSELKLKGYHNVQNVCAAAAVAKVLGISNELIWKTCKDFAGYEHRLQFVAERKGIKFYDDSSGTNIYSTLTAVDSFTEPVTLIVGGFDKGQDYELLGRELAKRVSRPLKNIVLLGTISAKIYKGLEAEGISSGKGPVIQIDETSSKAYDEAIDRIRGLVKEGDVVLLAPGTSSFDMFKNYKERGEYFSELAKMF